MSKIGWIFTKKVFVPISGLMFTGVALASSGAGSAISAKILNAQEIKVPEVTRAEEPTSIPLALQVPDNNSVDSDAQPELETTAANVNSQNSVGLDTAIPNPTSSPLPVNTSLSANVRFGESENEKEESEARNGHVDEAFESAVKESEGSE